MEEYSKMAAQTLPRGLAGTRHKGPRYLASQPLGKWFSSVGLVREVLAGTFRAMHILLYNFGFLKF
jgi:hypothetical protein